MQGSDSVSCPCGTETCQDMGSTISAWQNFDDRHVWLVVGARGSRDERDERGLEVRSSRFSKLRTSDRAFLSCLARLVRRALESAGGLFQHPAIIPPIAQRTIQ